MADPPSVGALDLEPAGKVLAGADFELSASAAQLWSDDDGLPAPDSPGFAAAAARFAVDHPVTPIDQRGPTLWDAQAAASRQLKCLTYLASGTTTADREAIGSLCVLQAQRLQVALPIRVGHGDRVDRTLFAGAAASAATGDVLRAGTEPGSALWEVSGQWLRTGLGQLQTYGARGAEADRAAALSVVGSLRATAEDVPLGGSLQAFFAQIDLTRDDMREVARSAAAGDWAAAEEAYAEALAARFSPERGWPDVLFDREVDLGEADDICRNTFVLQAHMFRRMEFGERVDWAAVIDNDIESRVWMNAHPWMWALLNAYGATHDERYVDHLCRLVNSWYESSPPTFARTAAQWRTLEVGGRAGQKWPPALLALAGHPTFRRECLVNMARSLLDHGKYLCMYAAGGGNWLQVESSGLACVALLFPEFKLSPLFYDTAMNRLAWVNARSFLPDGFQSECSPGYHRFPLIGMAAALRLADFTGAPVPESFMRQYEAGVEVLEYIAYPDGTLPMLSDVSPRRDGIGEVMQTGAEVFGRADFRWFASEGAQGEPPATPSHDFTHAGYCVMRDRWGQDGQVLIFDAGYFGAGHQHEDKLNFVYYAGGRELIGDPGIYSYLRNEYEPYWRGSWSHNTVVIDGLSQHRGLGPAEAMPDPDRRFVIGEGFDFAAGWYRGAYSPRGTLPGRPDREQAVRDFAHQRLVFYLKGRFALIADRVLGPGDHTVELLFHPAPVASGEGIAATTRPADVAVLPEGVALTRERDCANVAIVPASPHGWDVSDLIGQRDPVRGWFALFGIQPSHDVVYRYRGSLPIVAETLIQPLPPGSEAWLRVARLPVTEAEGRTCSALQCGADLFLVSYDGPADMTCGEVRFRGTAAYLEGGADGPLLRAHLVDGQVLQIGGETLLSTDSPVPAVTLSTAAQ